jgi:hypothetical protein
MTWNVGCSTSSDTGGNGTLVVSDGSKGGAAGVDVSGKAVETGTDSTCILFEQYKYLKLKNNSLD